MEASIYDRKTYELYTSDDSRINIIRVGLPQKHIHSYTSLVCDVGHYDNPSDVMGMAHFCEHLLFMGSEKYPDEDAYQKHVDENDGHCNAYTDYTHTNYEFSVRSTAFEKTLDMFLAMFDQPLFREESVDKEINAVHSEFEKSQSQDWFLDEAIFHSRVNPEHPYSKFVFGNKESLTHTKDSLANKTRDFFERYYRSSKYYLVIAHPNNDISMSTLIEMMNPIKNKLTPINPTPIPPLIITSPPIHYRYISKSTDLNSLKIMLMFNNVKPQDLDLLAFCIKRDVPGNPAHYLVHEVKSTIAISCHTSCYPRNEINSDGTRICDGTLEIIVILADDDHDNDDHNNDANDDHDNDDHDNDDHDDNDNNDIIKILINHVYELIKFIPNQPNIINYFNTLRENSFHGIQNAHMNDTMEFVEMLAASMHKHTQNNYLKMYQPVVEPQYPNKENIHITIISSIICNCEDVSCECISGVSKIEHYTKREYWQQPNNPLDASHDSSHDSPDDSSHDSPDDTPDDTQHDSPHDSPHDLLFRLSPTQYYSTLINVDENIDFNHINDKSVHINLDYTYPLFHINIFFITDDDITTRIYQEILIEMITLHMQKTGVIQSLGEAKIKISINMSSRGFYLSFTAPPTKQSIDALVFYINNLTSYNENFDMAQRNVFKELIEEKNSQPFELLMMNLENLSMNRNVSSDTIQALSTRNQNPNLIIPTDIPLETPLGRRLRVAATATLNDVNIPSICKQVKYMIAGTISENLARHIEYNIDTIVNAKIRITDTVSQKPPRIRIPSCFQRYNTNDPNKACAFVLQCELTKKNYIMMRILRKEFKQEFFNELRTEKQLGYICNIYPINTPFHCMLVGLIQHSPKFSKHTVQNHMMKFFKSCRDKLDNNIHTLERVIELDMEELEQPFSTPHRKYTQYMGQLLTNHPTKDEQIEILSQLKQNNYNDIKQFYYSLLRLYQFAHV
uniref:Insulinase n=1 Tax=Megaviridae environmental sample TaxID=1737588 RepID=A0A5J6VJ59_9VIRU|nr:MAG: insulinase [Megaviridae environmental sample]